DIGVAHFRGRMDHDFGHQPVGVALAVTAARKILGDVIDAPRLQSAALGAVEPRREPTRDPPAAEPPAALVGTEYVFRRVAGAAMRKRGDEIAAAIPGRALILVRLEDAGPEEQKIPGP